MHYPESPKVITYSIGNFGKRDVVSRSRSHEAFCKPVLSILFFQNFDLRRKVYGDECLGERNLKMVEIGRKFGAACKFPGKAKCILL